MSCLFLVTASRMRACACDTASRLCVRTVLCSSAFSLAPPLRSTGSAAAEAALFACFSLLRAGPTSPRAHRRLRPPAFPTRSRPRLAGTAMEISRFPRKRLIRMPGSTTTRGRLVSCDDDTGPVAFCWTENIGTPNLLSPLNTSPAHSPVNASLAASRPHAHDSGSVWLATPSP